MSKAGARVEVPTSLPKVETSRPFTNCTAASPSDPKAGLPKPKTKAAWRKAFWAGKP